MEDIVKKFSEFINEDLNYEKYENECVLIRNWYYYDPNDDIIYGSNSQPSGNYPIIIGINNDENLFYLDGEEFTSETSENERLCLLMYDYDTGQSTLFTSISDIINELKSLGLRDFNKYNDISRNGERIQDIFDEEEDFKFMLLDGNSLIASSFDIIEEN